MVLYAIYRERKKKHLVLPEAYVEKIAVTVIEVGALETQQATYNIVCAKPIIDQPTHQSNV